MTTVSYLTGATNETYSSGAFSYIGKLKDQINETANVIGISAGAIAGAMAEENTAYDFKDQALDLYAKSGLDPSVALVTLPASLLRGQAGATLWLAQNALQLLSTRSHAEWKAYYQEAIVLGHAPSATEKIMNPALIDAGYANFKISTAIDLVVKHAAKPEYAALNLTPYLSNYTGLVADLMSETSPLTAKLYGLYMKEEAEPFFKDNNAYAGQWDSLPQTLRDALLVTYTNIGKEGMTKLMKSPYEPQPGLMTGGGMNHLRNAEAIGSVLGLAGYGQDAVGVGSFATAQLGGSAGLAERYALQQLRYVAIDGIDYDAKNADGSLDLYDPATGRGAMSENYIADRSAMLGWWVKLLWEGASSSGTKPYAGTEDAYYKDYASGKEVVLQNTGAVKRAILFGSNVDEILTGTIRNDRLYGAGGNDSLKGDAGDDYLEGGAGDDVLHGGAGKDTLDGGAGVDTYYADDGDTLLDGDGLGSLTLGSKTVQGAFTRSSEHTWTNADGVTCQVAGQDLIVAYQGQRVTLKNACAAALTDKGFLGINLGSALPAPPTTSNTWTGVNTNNYWVANARRVGGFYIDTTGAELFDMGNGNDTVQSQWGDDQFHGKGGNDLFMGGLGNNIAYGGDGDDTLVKGIVPTLNWDGSSWTASVVRGTEQNLYQGTVKVYAMNGGQDGRLSNAQDQFFGEAGRDWLWGAAGNDWLDGGADDDVVFGDADDDDIIGGSGDDILSGDNLGALALHGSLHGNDVIDAGDGNDKVFGNGGDDILSGGAGDDLLWGDDEATPLEFHGDDVIDAGAGNDKVYAGGGDDIALGGTGNDLLVGGEGSDHLYGGDGDDRLVGDLPEAQDVYSGTKLYAHASGTLLTVLQRQSIGKDMISNSYQLDESQAGDDWLDGGAGNDTLLGGAGNDILIGGTGDDTLDGGAGDDLYYFNVGDGADVIRAVQGADRLLLGNGLRFEDAALTRQGGDLKLAWGSDSVTLQGYFGSGYDTAQMPLVQSDGSELDATAVRQKLGDGIAQNLPGSGTWVAQAPTVTAPQLTLAEGRGDTSVVLTLGMLGVRDPDSSPEQLRIRVSGVSGGRFMQDRSGANAQEVSTFTAADVHAGRVRFVHGFNTGTPGFSVSATDEAGLGSGAPVAASVHFTPAAQVIFGDASGSGGAAGYVSHNGGDGGGGNDTLIGTAQGDLIFGDGSGGGEGQRTGWWGSNDGHAGRAGGGDDVIRGGDGNDLLFGDGFDGGEVTAGLGVGGAGGYGGGGSGSGNASAGVGGGAGSAGQGANSTPGGAATLGPNAAGGGIAYSNGSNRGGAGAGVGTAGSTGDGRNGNEAQIVDALSPDLYQRVLADLNNRSSAIYTQTMGSGADLLDGGAGDDWLMAGGGNDILIGGTGNDTLDGGAGDDTYRFNAGDGQDVIQVRADSGADRLELGTGLSAADMQLQRNGQDLRCSWASGEAITLRDYFKHLLPAAREGHAAPANTLTLVFANGSTWQAADIQARLGLVIFGDTSGSGGAAGYVSNNGGDGGGNGGGGNDTLVGTPQGDLIFGDGSGGGEGQRTGWWGSNDGHAGRAGGGDDLIRGGDGNDLIFGDGFDGGEVTAGLGVGGAGGYGGGGSGSGNAFASVGGGAGSTGQGTNSAPGGAATLGPDVPGGAVAYSNGSNRGGAGAGVGTAGVTGAGGHGNNDQITDTLSRDVYDRVLADLRNPDSALYRQSMGAGNDTLDGGAGDDWLLGGGGNDLLIGGTGNDMLLGGLGADTYQYARGDGQDTVIENDANAGAQDVLQFGAGITADQIWLRQTGQDLEISLIGTTDKITVSNWYLGQARHIEVLHLADGRQLLDSQVQQLVQAMAQFNPPAPGQTTLPQGYSDALGTVIATNWQ